MKALIFTQDGEKKGTMDLPVEIFGVEASDNLIHEALVRYLANKRTNIAKTKTRTEVRGGGRKPWRQKGTGRARQGSIRAPHWRGGGVTFGPTGMENYSKEMPKKMRRKALFGALSRKAKADDILILESFSLETPKTKIFADLVNKLPVQRDLLIVLDSKNPITEKSARNLSNTKIILANFLNIHDILKHDKILFIKEAIDMTKKIFISSKK